MASPMAATSSSKMPVIKKQGVMKFRWFERRIIDKDPSPQYKNN
jgi:hypothetical protein